MTTTETKQLDPAALSSLLHGIILCDFRSMHEAAEWVAGHPVWTHQFVHKPLRDRIKSEILRQFPTMDTRKPDDWKLRLDDVRATYGETVTVERGSGEMPDLMVGLEGKNVAMVTV